MTHFEIQCSHKMKVGIRELKNRTSALMRRVAEGETVEVTDRGRPVARLVPVRSSPWEQLVAEGRATPARRDLLAIMDELGLPMPAQPGQRSLSAILAEMRDEETR